MPPALRWRPLDAPSIRSWLSCAPSWKNLPPAHGPGIEKVLIRSRGRYRAWLEELHAFSLLSLSSTPSLQSVSLVPVACCGRLRSAFPGAWIHVSPASFVPNRSANPPDSARRNPETGNR